MIDVLINTPGLRLSEVLSAVRVSRPNTMTQHISNSLNRYIIGGKLPVERTFFYRSSGKWFIDAEKARNWLLPRRKSSPAKMEISHKETDSEYCFDLVEAAERAGVTVREIVQAIKSGKLTADFVEEPVATYVIDIADIDRAFSV